MSAIAATMTYPGLVPPAASATFARDGAVCVRGVLHPDWLARTSSLFETVIAHGDDMSGYYGEGQAGPGKTVVRINGWQVCPELLLHLKNSPLPRAAAEVVESQRVCLFEDLIIFKSAGAEQPTPWHQDEPQWPLRGLQLVSAWFCLDPVTPDTGALRFAAGSHRGPMYRPYAPPERAADYAADAAYFEGGPLPDVDADPGRFPVRAFDVNPGDVLFFHPRVLHSAIGSAPNHSRRTFSIRFLGDDVRAGNQSKSVFHKSLKDMPLREGDVVIVSDSFPLMYQWTLAAHVRNCRARARPQEAHHELRVYAFAITTIARSMPSARSTVAQGFGEVDDPYPKIHELHARGHSPSRRSARCLWFAAILAAGQNCRASWSFGVEPGGARVYSDGATYSNAIMQRIYNDSFGNRSTAWMRPIICDTGGCFRKRSCLRRRGRLGQ